MHVNIVNCFTVSSRQRQNFNIFDRISKFSGKKYIFSLLLVEIDPDPIRTSRPWMSIPIQIRIRQSYADFSEAFGAPVIQKFSCTDPSCEELFNTESGFFYCSLSGRCKDKRTRSKHNDLLQITYSLTRWKTNYAVASVSGLLASWGRGQKNWRGWTSETMGNPSGRPGRWALRRLILR